MDQRHVVVDLTVSQFDASVAVEPKTAALFVVRSTIGTRGVVIDPYVVADHSCAVGIEAATPLDVGRVVGDIDVIKINGRIPRRSEAAATDPNGVAVDLDELGRRSSNIDGATSRRIIERAAVLSSIASQLTVAIDVNRRAFGVIESAAQTTSARATRIGTSEVVRDNDVRQVCDRITTVPKSASVSRAVVVNCELPSIFDPVASTTPPEFQNPAP